jgi:hypothetical protein
LSRCVAGGIKDSRTLFFKLLQELLFGSGHPLWVPLAGEKQHGNAP